jgi:hypothetical protein
MEFSSGFLLKKYKFGTVFETVYIYWETCIYWEVYIPSTLTTGWTVRGSNPGEGDYFPLVQTFHGAHLLYNGY